MGCSLFRVCRSVVVISGHAGRRRVMVADTRLVFSKRCWTKAVEISVACALAGGTCGLLKVWANAAVLSSSEFHVSDLLPWCSLALAELQSDGCWVWAEILNTGKWGSLEKHSKMTVGDLMISGWWCCEEFICLHLCRAVCSNTRALWWR